MIEKLKCGCKHNGREWLKMCAPHKAEAEEVHTRWHCEHLAAMLEKYPDYRSTKLVESPIIEELLL